MTSGWKHTTNVIFIEKYARKQLFKEDFMSMYCTSLYELTFLKVFSV